MLDKQKNSKQEELRVLLMGLILFLGMVSAMMFLFSLTYVHDINLLRTVPSDLWNFICGKPVENGIALPLLLTFAIVSAIASVVLAFVRQGIKDGEA